MSFIVIVVVYCYNFPLLFIDLTDNTLFIKFITPTGQMKWHWKNMLVTPQQKRDVIHSNGSLEFILILTVFGKIALDFPPGSKLFYFYFYWLDRLQFLLFPLHPFTALFNLLFHNDSCKCPDLFKVLHIAVTISELEYCRDICLVLFYVK